MMRALRAVSTEKGRDPRDFVLVAYGGSGPVHAAALAAELGVAHGDRAAARRALLRGRPALRARRVPRRPLLPRRARASPTSTQLRRLDAEMREPRRRSAATRSGSASPTCATAARAGASRSTFRARSTRQASPSSSSASRPSTSGSTARASSPGSPVDIRALRLVALGPQPAEPFSLPRSRPSRDGASATRRADFGDGPRRLDAPVALAAPRSARAGATGPLLVDEYDTTVVVPPGWTVRLDPASGALVLDHVAVGSVQAAAAHDRRDRAAARRQRARDARRRDGDDDLPHRALGRRPRRDGLLGRALRARRARRSRRR